MLWGELVFFGLVFIYHEVCDKRLPCMQYTTPVATLAAFPVTLMCFSLFSLLIFIVWAEVGRFVIDHCTHRDAGVISHSSPNTIQRKGTSHSSQPTSPLSRWPWGTHSDPSGAEDLKNFQSKWSMLPQPKGSSPFGIKAQYTSLFFSFLTLSYFSLPLLAYLFFLFATFSVKPWVRKHSWMNTSPALQEVPGTAVCLWGVIKPSLIMIFSINH